MPCVRCQRDLAEDANYCPSCGAPQRGTTRFGGRLTRSASEAKIAGVCAGFANYFDVDVTLVRALWLIFSIVPGALIGGVVAYLVAWLVMPEAAPGVQVPVRSTRLRGRAPIEELRASAAGSQSTSAWTPRPFVSCG